MLILLIIDTGCYLSSQVKSEKQQEKQNPPARASRAI